MLIVTQYIIDNIYKPMKLKFTDSRLLLFRSLIPQESLILQLASQRLYNQTTDFKKNPRVGTYGLPL